MLKMNWNPKDTPVFIDTETRSSVNLKETTASKYVSHPSTELLSLVARCDGDEVVLRRDDYLTVDRSVSKLTDWVSQNKVFVGHNAINFDRRVLNRFLGLNPYWYDTMLPARAAGLPGGIDALGERLTGQGKVADGKRVLELLNNSHGTPALWNKLIEYNRRDVDILEMVYNTIRKFGEPDVMTVDQIVNNRGIRIDQELTSRIMKLWDDAGDDSLKKVERLTDGKLDATSLRSPKQMRRWCLDHGLDIDSLNRSTLARLYEDPSEFFEDEEDFDPLVIEVLNLRQIANRGSRGKVVTLNNLVDDDGRLRNSMVYCGAHTGRWSGRGFQPQNLPRGVTGVKYDLRRLWVVDKSKAPVYEKPLLELQWSDFLEIAALVSKLYDKRVDPDDVLTTLTRAVVVASEGLTLASYDFSKVELVCVAWLAGDEELLNALRSNVDLYCDMASSTIGRTVTKADEALRQLGKTQVLGCIYGISGKAFDRYCFTNMIDLNSLGVSGQVCVDTFRRKCPKIVKLWKNYGTAVLRCVESGNPQFTNYCSFRMEDGRLVIKLPSGREINYWDAKIEPVVPKWNPKGPPVDSVTYLGVYGNRKVLYGSKVTENIDQGICRDLMAGALVRCEQGKYQPVLHVHDQIVCEIESERCEGLHETIVDLPQWASGFPLQAEGGLLERFSK